MPVTPAGTPYVVGTDVVGAYPEISRSLADAIDAKNAAQDSTTAGLRADVNATNARTAGIARPGTSLTFDSGAGGVSSIEALTGNGQAGVGISTDANVSPPQSKFWHKHNGTWRVLFTTYFATAGNNELFTSTDTEWRFANSNNAFFGTLYGVYFPVKRGVTPDTLVVSDDMPEQLPEDGSVSFDVNATVVALAEQVQALQARVEQLEAR